MNRFPSVPSVSDFVGPILCPYCDLPLAGRCGNEWWEIHHFENNPTFGRRWVSDDPEGVVTCYHKGCGSGDMFLAFQAMSEDSEAVIRDLLKAVKRGQSWRVEPLARRLQDVSDDYVMVDKWDLELLLKAADTPLEEWYDEDPDDDFVDIVDTIEEKLFDAADCIRYES